MLRTFPFVILLVSLVPVASAQTLGEEFLPAGTILHCTLDEPNFSSRTAELGDPVLCHTGTLPALGRSLSYRGADLAGRFQDFRDPGHFFGKGWMGLTFDRLVLPGGVTLPLSAKVIAVSHFSQRVSTVLRRGVPNGPSPRFRITRIRPKRHREVTPSHVVRLFLS